MRWFCSMFCVSKFQGDDSLVWDVWLWAWAVLVGRPWERRCIRVIWHHSNFHVTWEMVINALHGQMAWRGKERSSSSEG